MAWLHTWSGLVVGWVLFFVFVTGTAGYFNHEITRWMQPELPLQAAQSRVPDPAPLLDQALDRLQQLAPEAEYWRITLPHQSLAQRGWQELEIEWSTLPKWGHENGVEGSEILDWHTGQPLQPVEPRATGGGNQLYVMHYALHYIPYETAYYIVGICTMLMFVAIISGVITHKKIFKDFFTFRPGKGQRSWLDAHNVISVMALPFFLMITYSGLIFFAESYMPAGVAAIYGTDDEAIELFYEELYAESEYEYTAVALPQASLADMVAHAEQAWGEGEVASIMIQRHEGRPPFVEVNRRYGGSVRPYDVPKFRFDAQTGAPLVDEPPDNTMVTISGTFTGLHEGRFASSWLRWLYFIAGLLGSAMIGTGLVLWTVKRRNEHEKRTGAPHFSLWLVEGLNAGTIAGLPVAVAAYFWANRLLPVELADRAAWEAHTLFIVWGELLLYAFVRGSRRAWVDTLWLAAAAYTLLPLLNALTTDRHLGVTLPSGDWVLAGFDLTMFTLGATFAYMAVRVQRKWASPATKAIPVHARNTTAEVHG